MDHQQVTHLCLGQVVRGQFLVILGKHIARLAQRPGHHCRLPWAVDRLAVGVEQGHAVVGPVHRRAHQVVETGVDHDEGIAAHLFHGAYLGHQVARFRHQEAPWLDLHAHGVALHRLDLLAGHGPGPGVALQVDRLVAAAVWGGKAAANGKRFDVHAQAADQLDHRAGHLLQVLIIHPRADVHVHPHQVQAMGFHAGQRFAQLFVPDAVLAVLATGVGLAAVAMAEAGVDSDPHAVAGRAFTQLAQHVDGTGVDFDLRGHHPLQGRPVQRVAGQHHAGRVAIHACARGKGPLHFAQRHCVQHQAVGAHQAQHMQVGVGLLGEAHGIEHFQLFDALGDGTGVIGP